MGLSADILPIVSGLVVFGERMPQSQIRYWMRIVGIAAAISGALVITFSPSTEHFLEQLEHGEIGPYARDTGSGDSEEVEDRE